MSTVKGSDIYALFVLVDKAGIVLDLSLYPGITVHIYQKKDTKNILIKYSRVTSSGFSPITITGNPGEIKILIPRAITKTMTSDDMLAMIKVRSVDSNGSASQFHTIASGIVIDQMEENVAPTDIIP
jgi:hypothetical protein